MAEALGAAANHTLTRQITDPRLLSAAIDALQFSVLMQRHIEAIPPLSPYVVGSDLKSVFEPFEEDFAETRELIWPRGVPDRPTA